MDASTFDFITSKSLRAKIVDSIEFVAYLWITAQEIDERYKDEIARTIILYNMSVVEALLLFRATKKNISFEETCYKQACAIPSTFQNDTKNIVLALQQVVSKEHSRIWLHDLIRKQKTFLGKDLCVQLERLQDIRNTFHLSKERVESPSLHDAQKSFDVLYGVVRIMEREVRGE